MNIYTIKKIGKMPLKKQESHASGFPAFFDTNK